jgi:hypothetical protein
MLRGQGEHGTFGGGDALACGGRGERWWLHWLTPVHRGIATQQHGPPRPRPLKTEPTHTPRALSPCEASRRASRVGPTTGGYGTPPAYTGTSPPTRGHLQSARGRSFPGKIPREGGQRAPIRRRRRLATCPKRLLGNSHQAGTHQGGSLPLRYARCGAVILRIAGGLTEAGCCCMLFGLPHRRTRRRRDEPLEPERSPPWGRFRDAGWRRAWGVCGGERRGG